jgi:glycosyltransferase involved in cell wall biosynthesis
MAFENRFPLDNCVKIPERPAKVAGQPPSKAKNRTNLLILVKTLLISGLMQRSHERYNLFLLAGVRLAKRKKLPYLLEVNAPMLHERNETEGISLKSLAKWTEQTAWKAADYALPVTDCRGDYLRRADVSEEKIKVIPNGINLGRFGERKDDGQLRKSLKLESKTVLGFTGFIREWHGLERVVDVMAGAPNRNELHFLVVGDGPARQSLEEYAAAKGMKDQVTVTGEGVQNSVSLA